MTIGCPTVKLLGCHPELSRREATRFSLSHFDRLNVTAARLCDATPHKDFPDAHKILLLTDTLDLLSFYNPVKSVMMGPQSGVEPPNQSILLLPDCSEF